MKGSYTFVIVLATLFAVYEVLLQFGVFEFSARPRKVVSEIEAKRRLNKKRRSETKKLALYAQCIEMFKGLFMSDSLRERHVYYIQRLELRSVILNRLYTPEEVRGKYVFPFLLSLFAIPLTIISPFVLIAPAYFLFKLLTYTASYKSKIQDEDTIIDNYFIDLYLLLYSKLKQGSRARLQGTVENYINTLECSKITRESKVMLKLSKYMLNLLALYEDHVAIPKLREIYSSATIVNFCNVATQALNGVENFDNLLTFKMQLTSRRTELMKIRQQKLLRKGERSIYAIWLILGILVVVGFYSKLPKGVF